MKLQSILAAIAALSSYALSAAAISFVIMAVSDEAAINGRMMNAVHGFFYFNEDTVSDCQPGAFCPNAKETIFTTSGYGLNLSIADPVKTQRVFAHTINNSPKVFDSGKLAFYAAGSDDGNGGLYGGFALVNGYLTSPGAGGDFVACNLYNTVYAVFIGGGGVPQLTCVPFRAKYATLEGNPNSDYPGPDPPLV